MDFFERLSQLRVHKKGSERAPHKPLYLLLLLSGVQQGMPRLRPYADLEKPLSESLKLFARRTSSVSPQYPFWRLQNDGLSNVEPCDPILYNIRGGNTDPNVSSLREQGAKGGLCPQDYELLAEHPESLQRACHQLLDAHFPMSLHEDILNFFGFQGLGLKDEGGDVLQTGFREHLLTAYGYKCAISGFTGVARLNGPGLEATEIQWLNHGGVCIASNFIVMTALHRKLFHLGLFSLGDDYSILLSDELNESLGFGLVGGRVVNFFSPPDSHPSQSYMKWHREKVFRG